MSWEAEPPGQTRPVTDPEAWQAAVNIDNHALAVGASADELWQVLDSLFGTPRADGEARRMQRAQERRRR